MEDSEPFNQDAEEGQWVNLPMMMQQFADKNYAQYQLELFEGQKRLQKGEIKESKYESICKNATRPLVLMQCTGQPATVRYIKDHLVKEANGGLKLKAPVFNSNCSEYIHLQVI